MSLAKHFSTFLFFLGTLFLGQNSYGCWPFSCSSTDPAVLLTEATRLTATAFQRAGGSEHIQGPRQSSELNQPHLTNSLSAFTAILRREFPSIHRNMEGFFSDLNILLSDGSLSTNQMAQFDRTLRWGFQTMNHLFIIQDRNFRPHIDFMLSSREGSGALLTTYTMALAPSGDFNGAPPSSGPGVRLFLGGLPEVLQIGPTNYGAILERVMPRAFENLQNFLMSSPSETSSVQDFSQPVNSIFVQPADGVVVQSDENQTNSENIMTPRQNNLVFRPYFHGIGGGRSAM